MDGKFESRGGCAWDSAGRKRQYNERQAADKQSAPAKVTEASGEKGVFLFWKF